MNCSETSFAGPKSTPLLGWPPLIMAGESQGAKIRTNAREGCQSIQFKLIGLAARCWTHGR
jgi:hypothetical protein